MSPFASLVVSLVVAAAPSGETILAEVNGRAITRDDLDAYLILHGIPESASPAVRSRITQDLIDRELIRRFLERNKIEADAELLSVAVESAKIRLAEGEESSEGTPAPHAIDDARLKSELALPLAWRKLVNRAVTEEQIRSHFETHRRRLDGTKLRVAQIFRKYEGDESPKGAPRTSARLEAIREEILAGRTTFSDAAKAHSQAATAASGGDVGWIGPVGDLPAAVTEPAYTLDEKGVSDVILSPFGAHLVTVLEVEPGDVSLEDARPAVLEELAEALWKETVAAEHKAAKIVSDDAP